MVYCNVAGEFYLILIIFCSDLSPLQTISLTSDMVASSQHVFQAALSSSSRMDFSSGWLYPFRTPFQFAFAVFYFGNIQTTSGRAE